MSTLLLSLWLYAAGQTMVRESFPLTVSVVDRKTNAPISAEVWIGESSLHTDAKTGGAFTELTTGRYRIAIVADDPQYPVASGYLGIPTPSNAVQYRLTRLSAPEK